MVTSLFLRLCSIIIVHLVSSQSQPFIEPERIEEYHRRDFNWPPKPEEYTPNTPGWRRIFERRFRQIEQLDDPGKMYVFLPAIHSALTCPNFTENGWGLTRAPQHIVDALVNSLHHGLSFEPVYEYTELGNHIIDYDETMSHEPIFIEQEDLNARILEELAPLHEAWSGVSLTPSNAYGLRVYQNTSSLHMHVDNLHTHIISSILHVDHDPDADPWPIVIEDFQGNLNEVFLESGDMLLYESSKCMHGRPRKFNGRGYSSLFMHYYPSEWDADKLHADATFRLPPGWHETKPSQDGLEGVSTVGTALLEPECDDNFCSLKESVKWRGPGKFGEVLSAGGSRTLLNFQGSDEL